MLIRLSDLLFEAVMGEREALLRQRSARALSVLLHAVTSAGKSDMVCEPTQGLAAPQSEGSELTTHVMGKISQALADAIVQAASQEDDDGGDVAALLNESALGVEMGAKKGRKRKGQEVDEKTVQKKGRVVDENGRDYSSTSHDLSSYS